MTNGFDIEQVSAAMLKRIGWQASTLPGQPVLNDDNKASASKRYFNDTHALVTVPNVKSIIDNPAVTDEQFNTELENLQSAVIMRALTAVFSDPEILEQVLLFTRLGRLDQAIANTDSFVGYEINIAKAFDIGVQIESATFLFDTDKTFTVYLFSDGSTVPLYSEEVTVEANELTIIDFEDFILNYISPLAKGRKFYFGYFQADIGDAKAIREEVACWDKTCCFRVAPFAAKRIGEDFDRNQISYAGFPYGMNLQMSSFRDWTALIVKKANVFDELILLNMAYVVIEKLVYTTRSNGTERVLKDALVLSSAIADLTGVAPVSDGPAPVIGLNKRIEREILRVKKSLLPYLKAQTVNLAS